MRNILLFCVIIIGLGMLMGMGFYKDKHISKDGIKIVIYKQGKEIPIDPNTPHFKELQEKCEEFFASSTDMMKCFISKEMLSAAKDKESAIEVVYKKAKEINITLYNKKVKADHLLIPLTGPEAKRGEDAYVIIYFYDRTLHASPHFSPRDVTEIIDLLKLMGIDIN